MTRKTILRVVSKILISFIFLFAFYTQFHGDFGPGGGFQAGVIFASGVILYALIFGLDEARKFAPPRAIEVLMSVGLMIYAGTGILTLVLGGNFLDYDRIQPEHPTHGQHLGILFVELGVGIAVAAVMIGIIGAFAARGREL